MAFGLVAFGLVAFGLVGPSGQTGASLNLFKGGKYLNLLEIEEIVGLSGL